MRALTLFAVVVVGTGSFGGCAPATSGTSGETRASKVTRIEPGPDARKQAQTALINAQEGETVEFAEGKFEFDSTLSLDADGVTIRGAGPDKTILSFAAQQQGTGGEGILISSKNNVVIEDLAVEDAKGDAIKFNGTHGATLRKVRAEWTGGAKTSNGAYGLYPVLCTDVLIEDCTAIGASDAGIYVGQSANIIVRRCTASQNVAGIEIENSDGADVYENTATDNSGGILVFTLPDLEKKDGRNCRVYKNNVVGNNHENFGAPGTAVANVPPGTGIMVMANDRVEVFNNQIENNDTAAVTIVSYLVTGNEIKDAKFDPYCEAIYVHDNRYANNGTKPGGKLGASLGTLLGGKLPDILYDGVVDETKLVDGKLPDDLAIRINEVDDVTFCNFDFTSLMANPLAAKVSKDVGPFKGELAALPAVEIEGVE